MLDRLKRNDLKGEALQAEMEKILALVLARTQPKAVVLFGSAVRDALTSGSDIDLAIVFGTPEECETLP